MFCRFCQTVITISSFCWWTNSKPHWIYEWNQQNLIYGNVLQWTVCYPFLVGIIKIVYTWVFVKNKRKAKKKWKSKTKKKKIKESNIIQQIWWNNVFVTLSHLNSVCVFISMRNFHVSANISWLFIVDVLSNTHDCLENPSKHFLHTFISLSTFFGFKMILCHDFF